MANRRRASKRSAGRISELAHSRRSEILGFSLLAFALLVLLSLISYDRFDTGLYTSDSNAVTNNVVGLVGAWLAEGLFFPFGLTAFVLPGVTAWWAWRVFMGGEPRNELRVKVAGLVLLMVAATAILATFNVVWHGREFRAGGLIGYYLDSRAQVWFGPLGSRVLSTALAFIGFLLTTDLLVFAMIRRFSEALSVLLLWAWRVTSRTAPGAWQWTAAHMGAWRNSAKELRTKRANRSLLRRVYAGPPEVTTGPVGVTTLPGLRRRGLRITGTADPRIKPARARTPAADVDPHEVATLPGAKERRGLAAFLGRRRTVRPAAPVGSDDADLALASSPGISDPEYDEEFQQSDWTQPRSATSGTGSAASAARKPARRRRHGKFILPPLDICTESTVSPAAPTREQIEVLAAKLEEALETFGIEAEVLNVVRGPTITRFELRLAPGIKVSRVHALGDDLALAMEVLRVRIEAPIPGRAAIGIEIPNEDRDEVHVRDVLGSREYRRSTAPLTLALGKDIAGTPVLIDLAAMPHLLIAGATGTGKTVCVNALIASILFRSPPEDVRLLLIDPKMVELSQYEGIPNLLWPVVTDAKDASKYLQWLVREMENRYAKLARARTRNIQAYNALADENRRAGWGTDDEDAVEDEHTPTERLPYIVTVIDELADLMMVSARDVEDSIARLAQLARAVGIHLILATQRPSVDVLTGVIKANFPARLSFAVRSKVDSRTILDAAGAERLIGRGDLLYLPAGHSRPVRVQGALIEDDEIEALVEHLCAQGEPDYLDPDEELEPDLGADGAAHVVDDDLFPEAVRLVLTSGQASISMLQRRLRIGYARAARLVDGMELQGIVGPGVGSKPRELLVGLEFLERIDDPQYA